MAKSRFMEQSTHFHGLARDFEIKIVTCKGSSMRRSDEAKRKTVLIEKTNCLHDRKHSRDKDESTTEHMLKGPSWKFRREAEEAVKDVLQQKVSAFTEVRRIAEKPNIKKPREVERGDRTAYFGKDRVKEFPGSAFTFVWPTRVSGEPKSAFSKPPKCREDGGAPTAFHPLTGTLASPEKLSGYLRATDLMQLNSHFTCNFLLSDLHSVHLLSTSLVQSCNPFTYSSVLWPNDVGGQTQATPTSASSSFPASLALLPPAFTSSGIPAENWCAKCSLSFCLTSDLVLHMRSHHRKMGVSPESKGRSKREQKLSCPVCQEYFRERHHLSRHMTLHN